MVCCVNFAVNESKTTISRMNVNERLLNCCLIRYKICLRWIRRKKYGIFVCSYTGVVTKPVLVFLFSIFHWNKIFVCYTKHVLYTQPAASRNGGSPTIQSTHTSEWKSNFFFSVFVFNPLHLFIRFVFFFSFIAHTMYTHTTSKQ